MYDPAPVHPSPPADAPRSAAPALGLLALGSSTLVAAWLLPAPPVGLALLPCYVAHLTILAVFLWLIATPGTRLHRPRWEQRQIAVLLAFMPVVYLASLLLHRAADASAASSSWLAAELLGLLVYPALALLGARKAPWLIGAGVLAHGLLWDAWHIGRAPFMPDWYTVACLIVDLGWGLWALTRARAWAEAGSV